MNLPGISRPLRAAGLALVGVAVIAVAIGTVTVVTGDADEAAAPSGEQTTTTAPGEGDGGESPTSTPGSPSESPSGSATESETATSEPGDGSGSGDGDGAGKDGSGDGDGSDSGKTTDAPDGKDDMDSGKDGSSLQEIVDVRVYNNSKISGLASRASRDLEARGWDVVETGNYSDGVIYTTTAYYRPGTNEEAAAQAIGENFSMRVEPRFDGIEDASPGVIVIVTKDYEGRQTGK